MNWAGPKTKRATVQGPLGKLELQGGSQMLHCSRRLTVSLGVLFLAFAMCTAVAFGQAAPPATYSHDAYLDNQVTVNNCSAGEPVALNGNMHFQYSFTTGSDGVNHFAITAANNLSGVGQTTSTNYVANDSDEYGVNSGQPSADVTAELRSQLTSQGSSPSMMLVQTIHITADTSGNITGQVVSNTTQCGSN